MIPSVTGQELSLSREKLKHMMVNSFFLLADLFNQVVVDPLQSRSLNYIDIEKHGRNDSIIDISWKNYLLTYRKGLRALFKVLYNRQNIAGAPIAPSFEKSDNDLTSQEKVQREELYVYFDNLINQLIHITSKLTGWSFERLAQQPNPEGLLLLMTPEESVSPQVSSADIVDELLAKNKLETPLKAETIQNSDMIMQRCSAIMDLSIVSFHCGARYESDFFAWYRQLTGETPNIPLDERIFRFLAEKRSNFFDLVIKQFGAMQGLNDINNLHNEALFIVGKQLGLPGHNQAYTHDVFSPFVNLPLTQKIIALIPLLFLFNLLHTPSKIIDTLEEAINGSKAVFGDRIPHTKVFPTELVKQWLKENIEKFIPATKRSELEKEALEVFNQEWQVQNPHQNKEDEINKYIKESYYWSHLYKNNLFTREAIKAILLHLRPSELEKPYLTENFNIFHAIKFAKQRWTSGTPFSKQIELTLVFEKPRASSAVKLQLNIGELSESAFDLDLPVFSYELGRHLFSYELESRQKHTSKKSIVNSEITFSLFLKENKGSFSVLVDTGPQSYQTYKVQYSFNGDNYSYSIEDTGEVIQNNFSEEKKSPPRENRYPLSFEEPDSDMPDLI
jgi:hypothetical protein